MVRGYTAGNIMGLDELINDGKNGEESKTPDTDEDISTGGAETAVIGNTEPATDTLPDTKMCPNCGTESGLYDDVWECTMEWCRVEFFLTEEGHFVPSPEEDDGFLSSYSV